MNARAELGAPVAADRGYNFAYLDDPKNTEHDYADVLKRIRLGDNWQFTTGGDLRSRYQNEYNSRLTEANNDYHLSRARIYGDLWFKDDFRMYVEGIGAFTTGQELRPLPIDDTGFDFLNLFFDLKLFDWNNAPVYARVGRQELLLGSQRLVSPLDWANTRRTFDGVRFLRSSEKTDVDLFWLQPMGHEAAVEIVLQFLQARWNGRDRPLDAFAIIRMHPLLRLHLGPKIRHR